MLPCVRMKIRFVWSVALCADEDTTIFRNACNSSAVDSASDHRIPESSIRSNLESPVDVFVK